MGPAMKCPNCGRGGISRVGVWPVRFWRRLAHRNVYVCHSCETWWRCPDFDASLPVESGLHIRFHR